MRLVPVACNSDMAESSNQVISPSTQIEDKVSGIIFLARLNQSRVITWSCLVRVEFFRFLNNKISTPSSK